MPLLQRYILGQLLRVFLFAVSVLTILLVFVGVFAQAQERGLGPAQAVQILPYVVPSMLPFTLPATLLLTVCVVFGRMAGDLEITAAKAAGISTMTLLWPAFALGAIMSGVSYYAMDQVTPWAMGNIERTVAEAMEDIFLDVLASKKTFANHQQGYSVSVTKIEDRRTDGGARTLIKPIFRYAPLGKRATTVAADEATLSFDIEKREVSIHLIKAHVDMPGRTTAFFQEDKRTFPMPTQAELTKPRWLSTTDIRTRLEEMEAKQTRTHAVRRMDYAFSLALGEYHEFAESTYQQRTIEELITGGLMLKMHTEIWSRLAMALSCFGFVFVGAPTAIWQGKKQFFSTFFACFLPILVGYYPVVMLTMNLSKTGDADPAVVMWIGNVLLLLAGIVLLRKVLRY